MSHLQEDAITYPVHLMERYFKLELDTGYERSKAHNDAKNSKILEGKSQTCGVVLTNCERCSMINYFSLVNNTINKLIFKS